ncbi:predicted protein [Botrytis cinerea T4]|uniref:DUF7918 domain-containing protein n=1 Tax=Botryotinia fuckeliana (strain T4) TaxID=999810 RepID=G2Y235_BOTF4|nr:predicted protein [Botrytis cinerea T4]
MEHTNRSTKAERSTVLKYVEVVPDKKFISSITTDKSYKWTSPYIVMDIMVDDVVITTHHFGRHEFEQEYQASSSHVHECIGSCGIENEQEKVRSFKFSKLSVYVHWDAISGRLECQSHIATLGIAKPIVDPRIRTIYDVKYLDFDRSRFVKPQRVYKLRYRSEDTVLLYDPSTNILKLVDSWGLVESLEVLLFVCWGNMVVESKPTIKLENDDEDVAEDVTGSIVKRERDEDLVESSMPAMKRAWPRRNER